MTQKKAGKQGNQESLTPQKNYEELDFTDDFIFCKVLTSDKSLCIELLELILGVRVVDIRYINQQQVMKETYDSKGIRLDVYVEDKDDVFNMEMQVEISSELPKRSRYYQDLMDLNLLEAGCHYKDLKRSYVIFICMKDVFKENLPVYTFENRCLENQELSLQDGTQKIFLNAAAADGEYGEQMSPKLRAFLQYLRTKHPGDDFTERLEERVRQVRTSAKWRLEYMKMELKLYEMHMAGREEGLIAGREEGRFAGREEANNSIVKKMYEKHYSIEEIADISGLSEEQIKKMIENAVVPV